METPHLIAHSVLMVRPIDFVFNEEAAEDNEFMHKQKSNETPEQIRIMAISEFDNAVQILKSKGINVIVFDKSQTTELDSIKTPDAVFPNNWISTEPNGRIILYPMYDEDRNAEKFQFGYIIEELLEQFEVKSVKHFNYKNQVLEGTGSLIIDRIKKRVYANISHRSDPQIILEWARMHGYEAIMFESQSPTGHSLYHTNILLSIADKYAVICKSCIKDKRKAEEVVSKLSEDREVIIITEDQTEKQFCGNILQLKNDSGEKFTVMSENAHKGFTEKQLTTLKKYGDIIVLPIPTIERIGGGSARCMLAEIYLQLKKN